MSPEAVTYRAELHATRDTTVEDLLRFMEQWVRDGAHITVQLQLLTIDSSCDVGIGSFTERECRSDEDTTSNGSIVGTMISSEEIVGATVGVTTVLVLIIMVLATVIIVVAVHIHRKKQQAAKNSE